MHWLCLSSDREELYIEDIKKATAAPPGGMLRFRYEEDLVSGSALRRIETKRYGDDLATICYVEKSETEPPILCPVRRARVASAWRDGSLVVVEFALTGFIQIRNSEEYRDNVLHSYRDLRVVARDRNVTVRPYCLIADGPPPGEVVSGSSDAWEDTITRLAHFGAFSRSGHFFRVGALRDQRKQYLKASDEGTWRLTAGHAYSFEVSHWHPVDSGHMDDLTFKCTSSSVELDRSRVRLRTRYNSQVVRVRAQQTLDRSDGVLTVNTVMGTTGDEVAFLELPLTVVPRRWRLFFVALLFSLLLGASDMLDAAGWQDLATVGAFSVLAAVVIAFGLRRLPSI